MKVLIPAAEIERRIDELGREIAAAYPDHQPVTIVGVLTGCLIFLADLIRRVDLPLRISLIQASSYRGETTDPGELQIHSDLLPDVTGCDVLLIDDILDTGRTISRIGAHLKSRGARSVRVAVLLRKRGRQEVPFEPDFCGFEIPNEFVVGYGLDYNNEYRHLPFIGVLPTP
jgi:hypoxanthine phosphoribosyltransferase